MFRQMRRNKQLLSEEETIQIVKNATSMTLALQGDNDYPYSLPISFVYDDHKIYFHGAKVGHKVDSIKRNPKASFSIIQEDRIVPEKYTTYFRSVVGFGKIHMITDEKEMHDKVALLAQKYRPGFIDDMEKEIQNEMPALCVFEFEIEHITGKEAIEFVRMKNEA